MLHTISNNETWLIQNQQVEFSSVIVGDLNFNLLDYTNSIVHAFTDTLYENVFTE